MGEHLPIRDRLMRQVEVDASTGCWNWTSRVDRDGYGRFTRRTSMGAHRVAYELFREPIPAGLQIDHLCRNRRCVNPEHLEPVTPLENVRRGTSIAVENAVKTHCARGHPYDERNTYHWRGHRHCRECNRIAREKYAARRAANA